MSVISADSFDPSTGMWTYNYTIDNPPVLITHLDIFVGQGPGIQPIPVFSTKPDGWTMYGAFSGTICSPPYNECGGFYEFYSGYGPGSISPGGSGSFSLVTSYAPTNDNGGNDFFLYGCQTFAPYTGCGVQAYGNVVVPDGADWLMYHPTTPIPSTLPLLLTGLGGLLWLASRSRS
jgi:hypothetical protein